MASYNEELLRLMPKVLRARDFHLYTEGGKRLVDLWLQGGKAVLGHKPPGVLLELKNSAERGLFSPLPHPLERRLVKALAVFFPGRSFRFYNDPSSMYCALKKALSDKGAPFQATDIPDPAFSNSNACRIADSTAAEISVSLWRPFVEPVPIAPIFIPILPCPLGPAVLALDKSLDASFPQGELIPPVLLAPAARALYDLAAQICSPNRQRYYRIEKAISDIWQRCGIYLTTRVDREKYTQLFRRFLEVGFLLPPSADEPLILPASMSKGEETQLAKLLAG